MLNEYTNMLEMQCRCIIGIETVDSDISKIYSSYDKSDIPLQAWNMLGKNMSDGSIVLIQCEINGWPGFRDNHISVGQLLPSYTRDEVVKLIAGGDRYRLDIGGRYHDTRRPIMASNRTDFRTLLPIRRAAYAYLYTHKNNWLVSGKLDWEPLRGHSRDNNLANCWRTFEEEPELYPYDVMTPEEEKQLNE